MTTPPSLAVNSNLENNVLTHVHNMTNIYQIVHSQDATTKVRVLHLTRHSMGLP